MRAVLVAMGLALATMPAYAQMTQTTARSEAQQRDARDADRAYQAMMKQVPDKPASNDPWAGIRGRDVAANRLPREAVAHRQSTTKRPRSEHQGIGTGKPSL
jgi:type II secretory pathway pseudopilin PulG